MPEVWLPYGMLEVSANLSTDRLGPILRPEFGGVLSLEALKEWVERLELKGEVVVVWRGIPRTLLDDVLRALRGHGIEPHPVDSLGKSAGRRVMVDGSTVELPEKASDSKVLVVSGLRPDGFFGIYCPTAALGETIGERVMGEAFKRFEGVPKPLEETGALWFLGRVAEELKSVVGLGILFDEGARYILGGGLDKISREGMKLFKEKASRSIRGRGLVASPGFEEKGTLATCLRAMWNVSGIGDGSGLVMLCKSSEGMGSKALELYVRGILKEVHRYVNGLEDLVMLERVRERIKVGVVSGLPSLYVRKLGLKPFRSMSDGIESLREYGRLTFVPKASLTVVRSMQRACSP